MYIDYLVSWGYGNDGNSHKVFDYLVSLGYI